MENNNPLFSVIIPTFNHAHLLKYALDSVLNQTYRNWEVIVVDNNSSDNTEDLVAEIKDKRITYLKIENQGIIAKSRNIGIQKSRGTWIAFLDADDSWSNKKLEICAQKINKHVDVIYHNLEIVTIEGYVKRKKYLNSRQIKKPILIDLLVGGNPIANSSAVVRKSMLEKIGGINESKGIIAAEDYNTWLRISFFGGKFLYIPKLLGYYSLHSNNISKRDMSRPTYNAAKDFKYLLTKEQKDKFLSNIFYIRGNYYYTKNTKNAILYFSFSLKKGDYIIILKSLVKIINIRIISFKKYISAIKL